MEFVAAITAFITAVTQGLKIAGYNFPARKRARLQLARHLENLKLSLKGDGKRLGGYVEFDRLIKAIEGAITVMEDNNRRAESDEAFWASIELVHEQLREAASVDLHNFDRSRLLDYHRGLMDSSIPRLQGQVAECNGLISARQRALYMNRLALAKTEAVAMRGYALEVIKEISSSLEAFEGVPNAG